MWSEIYHYIATIKPSDKPPSRVGCDDEEEFNEPKSYDDEMLNMQRFELHKVAFRPTVLHITNIVYWVASHVDL